MLILKIAAFWMPVMGIGGIIGAVETGTSPVNAVIVFLAGCILLALYSYLDSIRYRRDRETDRLIRSMQRKDKKTNPADVCEQRGGKVYGSKYMSILRSVFRSG